MSSVYYNPRSVGESERMARPIGVSPRVVRFIENRVGEKVVSIEQSFDADGFHFVFANGTSMMIAATYIEHIERESDSQEQTSRNQFEDMIMQEQAVDRAHSPSDVYLEYRDGTMHCNGTIRGAKFDACVEDESGEAPEFGADRFRRSLRKVYWYRYLKNKFKLE